MAKTYLRTGRISWSPLTASQQTMLANVAGINVGSTFSATLDGPTETFLINNGVIAIPSSAVVASSGDTAGNVPVDNGDGTYSWGAGGGGGGVTTFNTRSGAITLSKADVTGTGLAAADVSADASGAAAAAQAAAIAASEQGFVPTAVKATNYSAAAGEFVPVDASGGVVTVTLPTAPADKTRVGVKIVAQAGTPNTVTVARGGADVFNKAGGSTSLTLSALFQAVLLQYQSSTGIWYVQSADYQLPSSVVSVSSGTPSANQVPIFTGTGNAVTPGSVAGLPSNILTKTTTYTAAAGDFVEADATSAGFPVTLPTAPSVGALVAVKKIDSSVNTVTIAAGGGGTIDGSASTATATQWAGLILEHKGSNVWRVAASMSTTGPAGATGLGFGSVTAKTVSYTVLSGDNGSVLTFNGSSLIATLPAAAPGSPWMVTIINLNATSLTVSPNGLTLNGAVGSLTLAKNQSVFVWSDGANYEYGTGPTGPQGTAGSGGSQIGYSVALETGRYGYVGSPNYSGPSNFANGELFAIPVSFNKAATITSVGTFIWVGGSAGTVLAFGIYGSDASSNGPGALLSSATVATTGNKLQTATFSQAVTSGTLYWVAFAVQGAPATAPTFLTSRIEALLEGVTLSAAEINLSPYMYGWYSQTGVTAALPANWGAFTMATSIDAYPRLFIGT